MSKTVKDQEFVENDLISFEDVPGNDAMKRKILAYSDSLMCVENYFKSGAAAPLHSHPHTQIAYIVEGVFEFDADGKKYILKKGDSLFLKSNVLHGVKTIEKGIVLDVFNPMREDFVK
ncbi:MAG: cupin domain-containing protein [Elusimicrobiota bacterium]|jgi:quercetin dioxygenase-like cupin family protein|nr:cupin domain-containing protein [Elusimicrobiota bacterium]